MMKNGRMLWIDAAKGVGILAIMLGHIQYINWMEPFKIVIFFMVSGFLYSQKDEKMSIQKSIFLTKKMMIPYFVFSFIFLAVELLVTVAQRKSILYSLKTSLLMIISLRGLSTLWFLPTFLGGILLTLQIKKCNSVLQVGWCGIIMLLSCLYSCQQGIGIYIAKTFAGYILLSALKMCAASVFIILGFYIQKIGLTKSSTGKELYLKCGASISVLVGSILFSQYFFGSDFNNMYLSEYPIVYFCIAFMQSVAIMVLVNATFLGNSKILIFFGKNSLFFMITHHGFKFCRVITSVTKMILPSGVLKVLLDFTILLVVESILFLLWKSVKKQFGYVINIRAD